MLHMNDPGATADHLDEAGATREHEFIETPWGDRNARVRAPDGMQLALFTPAPGAGGEGSISRP